MGTENKRFFGDVLSGGLKMAVTKWRKPLGNMGKARHTLHSG